jgi:hypothetical protein
MVDKQSLDPRCRNYYIYKCNICGEETEIFCIPNFDTVRLRKCPHCGVIEDTDNREYLINKMHDLEQKIKSFQIEYDLTSKELNSILKQKENNIPIKESVLQ